MNGTNALLFRTHVPFFFHSCTSTEGSLMTSFLVLAPPDNPDRLRFKLAVLLLFPPPTSKLTRLLLHTAMGAPPVLLPLLSLLLRLLLQGATVALEAMPSDWINRSVSDIFLSRDITLSLELRCRFVNDSGQFGTEPVESQHLRLSKIYSLTHAQFHRITRRTRKLSLLISRHITLFLI